MQLTFFDDAHRAAFLPLAYTRPVAELRLGGRTLSEQWCDLLSGHADHWPHPSLRAVFPLKEHKEERLLINGRLVPEAILGRALSELEPGQCYKMGEQVLAARVNPTQFSELQSNDSWPQLDEQELLCEEYQVLERLPDLFTLNEEVIKREFKRLTYGRMSAAPDPTNTILGDPSALFIEEGATVEGVYLNTKKGPIYIGSEAEIGEGSAIAGPCFIAENVTVKPLSRVGGATTIGPWCKVGGEISNSIFQSYSNKGHDGYVGNSIIGEWCNLGADTNTSNLKNNYGEVSAFDYQTGTMQNTGLTFCGLIMGDHSKCGINTMFNTGTVVGVSANIFGGDFPPKHIPSWSWGGADGLSIYDFDKSLETAERMMARRDVQLHDNEKALMRHIYDETSVFRK